VKTFGPEAVVKNWDQLGGKTNSRMISEHLERYVVPGGDDRV
jgi:hypothetical protein